MGALQRRRASWGKSHDNLILPETLFRTPPGRRSFPTSGVATNPIAETQFSEAYFGNQWRILLA